MLAMAVMSLLPGESAPTVIRLNEPLRAFKAAEIRLNPK
jgi:hypothetical protein